MKFLISISFMFLLFSCEDANEFKPKIKYLSYQVSSNISNLKFYKGSSEYYLNFAIVNPTSNAQNAYFSVDSVVLKGSESGKILITRNSPTELFFTLKASDLIKNKDFLTARIYFNGEIRDIKGQYEVINYIPMIYEFDRDGLLFNNAEGLYFSDLINDNLGNIWVSIYGAGLAKYVGPSNTWIYYTTFSSNIVSDNVSQIKLDKNGNIYISYYDKLVISKFNGSSFDNLNVDLSYKTPTTIKSFNFDFNNILYVVTNTASLAKYENNTWVTIANDLNCAPSKFLEIDKDKNVYGSGVFNNAGYFFFFDKFGNKKFKLQTELPNNRATFVKSFADSIVFFSEQKSIIDRSKNNFFAIKHFDNIAADSYTLKSTLANVVDLIKDKNKNLWSISLTAESNTFITKKDSNFITKRSFYIDEYSKYSDYYDRFENLAIDKNDYLWATDGFNLYMIQLHL